MEKESDKMIKMINQLKLNYHELSLNKITEEELIHKNSDFIEKYPTLANKIKENTLDMNILYPMLMNLDKIKSNDITEHNASVEIGTLLRDTFVIPDLKSRGLDVSLNP
jgi:hypothetical protein